MAIAGAGFGASQALEQIIAEQMVRAQQAQRDRLAQEELEIRRQQLAESARQADVDAGQRQQTIDLQAGDRRERRNIQGIRRMAADGIMQRDGDLNDEDRRGLAALQIEAGDAPTMLDKPKPERDPIADHEAKLKLDAKYRPGQPDKPQVFNVGGGKLVDSTGKVVYDGGASGPGGPSAYAAERNARTSSAVESIIGDVNGWTTGYGGLLANLPQTDARKLRGKLDTLRANIAFNELTAMREASKTGGALGSVAVRELELLQNSLGNLDQLQDPSALVGELTKIKESAERWEQAAGGPAKAAPMQPVNSRGGETPRRLRFDKNGKPRP